ncbi:MAG: hypothetical protein JXR95_10900 [Deltaproteobacteria bacterium]|nr:hypothetical protein [Deltaproteobacteria bacterium]
MLGRISPPPHAGNVFIVGSQKNSGKTSTLNAVMASWREHLQKFSLMTTGHDGEDTDALYSIRKPPVSVQNGDIIVTTAKGLKNTQAELIYPLNTKLASDDYLGVFLIKNSGTVELFGAPSNDSLWGYIKILEKFNNIILIDGSFNRWTVTSTSEHYIIIAVSPGTFPTVEASIMWLKRRLELLEIKKMTREDISFEHIDINGPLTESVFKDVFEPGKIINVPSPSHIFLPDNILRKALTVLRVQKKPEILGISLNSSSVSGNIISPIDYFSLVSEQFPQYQIADFYGF